MRAAVVDEGEIILADRPDPVPGEGQILIKVAAAGLNNADLIQKRGFYPAPPGSPPDIPGLELSGTVVALGPGAQRFDAGQAVMAVVGGGAQAQLIVVHERTAMPVPPGVDLVAAGAFPEAFTTAHDALFTQAGLSLGEKVLIHGGAGGVGTAAIQLAVAAGARVTATVRDPNRHQLVADLGAEVLGPEEFASTGPYDVILELVGVHNLGPNLEALANQGRIVVIGVGAGSKGEIDLMRIMGKRAKIMGSTLRARPLEDKADAARRMENHVLAWLESGWLQVPIHATFDLEDAPAAYANFEAGGKFGKVVLTMS
ncbi:MAG: NAD(P)H-quinone oxidoreductase [Acidimicrobiales bacterium]